MVSSHGMKPRDAELVIAAACLFHDTGMSIHRTDHEQYSLFIASIGCRCCSTGSTTSPS